MDSVQEIKNRLNITDVVREYGQLHAGSSGSHKMICPFHDDHHPSMIVNEKRGIAWCFACNNGGDMFSFVQKMENCSFPEAVRFLAEKAGVTMEAYVPPSQEQVDEKERIFDVLLEAASFFEKQLQGNARAKGIVDERKLPEEILKKFRVGYAPDSFDALQKYLLEKGFSRKEMLRAGLIVAEDEKGERTRDKFKNRIMFPIWNNRGRVCAFGGRYIGDSDKAPKYLNSPETVVYKKSDVLYGLNFAEESMKKEKKAILVEGYYDVLAYFAVGIQNVIAVSGTAFTVQHAKRLKRYADTLVLSLDVDDAGQAASRRTAVIALQNDLPVELITIPGGKDPDEALREDKEGFLEAIEKSEPAVDAFIHRAVLHRDVQKLEDKRHILEELLPIFHALKPGVSRDHYLQMLADQLHVRIEALEQEIRNFSRTAPVVIPNRKINLHQRKITSLEYFLGLVFSLPQHFLEVQKSFLSDLLPAGEEKKFYKLLKKGYSSQSASYVETVWEELSAEESEKWKVISVYAEDHLGKLPDSLQQEELKKMMWEMNRKLVSQKMASLAEKLKGGAENATEILTQINELNKLQITFHQQ